jgi:ABC-type lipoprotein export system ATPase subunit/bifunctional DNA-binding transcriptional regulator/antitoxin component of YhaV-PrlF toxin-antitoxin module
VTDTIISCENLVKIYKIADLEVVALQGLDLAVERGEMLGIIGASGSGKSSLLNILGGLDRPSAGRVTVDGQDLLKLSDRALNRYRRKKVGFVWQQTSRNLIPYLTAQENVELPMTVAGMNRRLRREWTKELLEAVDLYEWRRHRLTQLSGGQQQRVAIAVALANRPVLLLGDEPTGEVDSVTAQTIMDTFRKLKDRLNLTTVIVTHDPRMVRQVDRVVAIRDGKTSTETIRRVSQLEQVMVGETPPEEQETEAENVTYHEYVVLDSAGRLQVPQEFRARYGLGTRAELEATEDGVLIRSIAGHGDEASKAGESGLEEQVARLFEDEKPPERKGLLSRFKPRRRKE